VAQILGSLEAQRPAVAVNESAVLALGLVGVFDDRFSRLPLFVLSGLRGGIFGFPSCSAMTGLRLCRRRTLASNGGQRVSLNEDAESHIRPRYSTLAP
jgi:hypothetical protein